MSMMSLEQLDDQPLPSLSAASFTDAALNPLRRRRSPPLLWFLVKRLPVLYARGRVARYDASVVQLFIRLLMYSTAHDEHSSLDVCCESMDRESLERFALVLLTQWLSGPKRPEHLWALHVQRQIGGLNSLMCLSEHILRQVPEEDDELKLLLDVFWQNELLGISFLHLFKAHDDERLSTVAEQKLGHDHERTRWSANSPAYYEKVLLRLNDELREMELLGGSRRFDLGTHHIMLEMNDFGELNVSASGDEFDVLTPSLVLTRSVLHREAWLLMDIFEHIAERWRALLHAANEAQHRWSRARWRTLFFEGAVMANWSKGLVWAEFDNNELVHTFRVAEDASLAHIHDEHYELCDTGQIGLAHASLLSTEEIQAWGEIFADYEIVAPFMQFSPRICEEWERVELEYFLLKGCRGRGTSREKFLMGMWRLTNSSSSYSSMDSWRKKIFAGHRRFFLGLDVNTNDYTVHYCSVLTRTGSMLHSPTMINLQTLSVDELRIVAEHVMQLFD